MTDFEFHDLVISYMFLLLVFQIVLTVALLRPQTWQLNIIKWGDCPARHAVSYYVPIISLIRPPRNSHVWLILYH